MNDHNQSTAIWLSQWCDATNTMNICQCIGQAHRASFSGGSRSLFIQSMMMVVGSASVSPGTQLWAFDTGGDVRSSPALSPDGATLYIGSDDAKVYALQTSTVEQQWAFDTGGHVRSSPALSPDGATLYIGSWDDKVYALPILDGGETVCGHLSANLRYPG